VARDTSFYYSFLVLPPRKREAIIAVWDFCRAVDDAVDEPDGASPQAGVAEWRREVARCFDAQPFTPPGLRLQPYIKEFGLPRQPFEDLIDGVEMDLKHVRYSTFSALYEYCWRVASTVGLICIEIFGYRHPSAREYAVALGVALQLTNIVRDVVPDLERGRIYIPQEDLQRFRCSEADLRGPAANSRARELIAYQCSRAREYYGRARALLPREDARSLVAAEIMAAIYHDILTRIERSGYDVFSGRVRVPRSRRAWIAMTVWAGTVTGWRVPA
jgi:15-cis-phytoene synthase